MADPNPLFNLSGKTLDAAGNAVGSVVVTITDDRLSGDSLSDTSDANGDWSVNLGDFESVWIVGDIINSKGVKDGFETTVRIYTLVEGDESENSNQNLTMLKNGPTQDILDGVKLTYLQAMSRLGRAFWKGVEDYTLTGSDVNQTGTDEFLEIPQNHAVYITGVYVGTSASASDDVIIKFFKNNSFDGASGENVQVGQTIQSSPDTGSSFIPIPLPIRVPYSSTSAKSIVMSLAGGTSDTATVSFVGFIIKEKNDT